LGIDSGVLTKEEVAIWKKQSETRQFASNFQFLLSHNGWRRGKLHALLGASHGGKSTLVRTLVIDALCANKRVGLILSEETKVEFLTELSHSKFDDKLLENLFIMSELDNDIEGPRDFFEKLDEFHGADKLDIIFYDNITTSAAYMDKGFELQAKVARKLKKFTSLNEIAMVIICHTGAGVTTNYNNLIEMNDIRGSKSIVNLIEFFYIMQTFHIGEQRNNTLRITKHRGQEVKNTMYMLYYFQSRRIFGKDEIVNFNKFKEIFKQRNKL